MIYFDNNSTTPVAPEVLEAMLPFLSASFGNPSSAHLAGQAAKLAVETARRQTALLLGAGSPDEIVFTSCGTESNNWAVLGAVRSDAAKKHVIISSVEHESVRKAAAQLANSGCRVTRIAVDADGALDLDELRRSLAGETALVSVMMANNETGVLFPVAEIAEIVKSTSNALVHVDGVNAAGKVPVKLENTAIDLFSISAHKFHGPKGVGALYVRRGTALSAYLLGGGQEASRRAGTEAVHQIVGLGAAAEKAADLRPMEHAAFLRDRLEEELLASVASAVVNGTRDTSRRLPNTTNISFEGLNGEVLMAKLDQAGICVSTGSACHSADHAPSAVLEAMDVPYSRAMGSIRFSLGRYNTASEVETVVAEVRRTVHEMAAFAAA